MAIASHFQHVHVKTVSPRRLLERETNDGCLGNKWRPLPIYICVHIYNGHVEWTRFGCFASSPSL